MLDPLVIRRQFPLLAAQRDLAYLDSAATTQKPQAVIDAMNAFQRTDYAAVHRGMYPLAERATDAYEGARERVRRFLNAASSSEIIFTKSCTEGINLVAIALSRGGTFAEGDCIALSVLEHHSNIVPWQQLGERKGIGIRWIAIDDAGHIDLRSLQSHLADGRVRLVAVTAQSNVLGVRPPLKEVIAAAHAAGALVLVDAAQSVAHHPIDVQALDCDFLAFSGHKLYGPTGIGVLYGKRALLEAMPPFLGGGMMIQEVREDGFTPADVPARFEAGTPPIVEAVGLHAAIDWLSQYSWTDIEQHERMIMAALLEKLGSIEGVHILSPGNTDDVSGCVSITVDEVHPHDLAHVLGQEAVCVRAGHHCTQPLHRKLGIVASLRISIGIYTTNDDVEKFIAALRKAQKKFR